MNKQDKEYLNLLFRAKLDPFIKQQKYINFALFILILMSVTGFKDGMKIISTVFAGL